MKHKKDNLFEITNDIFYSFFVGLLLRFNSKERWTPFMTSFYIYTVMANTLIATVYTVIFFIFSLIEYCKKRRLQKRIKAYRNSLKAEREVRLKNQQEQRNSVLKTDSKLNGSSKNILQKVSDVSVDENVDHFDNQSDLKLTKNNSMKELRHHRRSDMIQIRAIGEAEDHYLHRMGNYLRDKESLNYISHQFLSPIDQTEGDATSVKLSSSNVESVAPEKVKRDLKKFKRMRRKVKRKFRKEHNLS